MRRVPTYPLTVFHARKDAFGNSVYVIGERDAPNSQRFAIADVRGNKSPGLLREQGKAYAALFSVAPELYLFANDFLYHVLNGNIQRQETIDQLRASAEKLILKIKTMECPEPSNKRMR